MGAISGRCCRCRISWSQSFCHAQQLGAVRIRLLASECEPRRLIQVDCAIKEGGCVQLQKSSSFLYGETLHVIEQALAYS